MTNELIPINYEGEQPTVSARELYKSLEISKRFSAWFETNAQGFAENEDYTSVLSGTVVNNGAHIDVKDYALTVDMAKHICLMSRTEKGRQCRQYLINLEKAWNTPEQIFARALKMADREIERLKASNGRLSDDIRRMKPKEIFADAVSASHTSILVGELAKLLKQNGVETGQRRLFEWLRSNGYLIKSGSSKNMPTQRAMEMGLFEIKEGSYVNGEGVNITTKTAKITGRGQSYFINKFLAPGEEEEE